MSTNEKDLSVIEPETEAKTEDTGGKMTVKLSRPFEYEGKSYTELTFDFDSLTGNDDKAIEKECQAIGSNVFVPTLSGDYLIRMCARACKEEIGHDALLLMPLKDCSKIKMEARNFLLK